MDAFSTTWEHGFMLYDFYVPLQTGQGRAMQTLPGREDGQKDIDNDIGRNHSRSLGVCRQVRGPEQARPGAVRQAAGHAVRGD